jgi:FkbM family methyltransferase
MEFTEEEFARRIRQGLAASQPALEGRAAQDPDIRVVDVSELLLIRDDEEFLREAYRRILRREYDVPGFLHYRSMLRQHVPRSTVLRALVTSPEARQTGLAYTGLPGLTGAGAGLRVRLSWLWQALLNRARHVYRLAFLRPLEILDDKLAYQFQEQQKSAEQLSAKLDSYAAQLMAADQAMDRRLAELQGLRSQLSAELAETRRSLERELARRWQAHAEQLFMELDVVGGELRALTDSLNNALAEVRRQQAEISGMRENLLREFSRLADAQSGQLLARLEGLFRQATQVGQALVDRLGKIEARQEQLEAVLREQGARLDSHLRRPLIHAAGDILVTEVDGLIVALPGKEWRLAAYLAFRGPLEPGVTHLFRRLVRPGMVVVDVGAHFGWYTLQAARLLAGQGKVYSFEPTPETFALLRENVQLNGFLESGVVQLRPVALWDQRGRARLTRDPRDSTHNTLFGAVDGTEVIEVETWTLDEALAEERRVDVVKIDAEGAEARILRGMRRTLEANPAIRIILEFAPSHLKRAGEDPVAFTREIREVGLSIARIDDVSGDLLPVTEQELADAYSMMLLLTR